MDWEKLEVLMTVLDEGSLTGAAEKLSYTTSGLSRMITSMENETGFPLLFRSREGVRPTPECEMLLPAVREIPFWGNRFSEQVRSIQGIESGRICVGTAYEAYYPWLSRIIADFSAEHPGIQIDILEGTSSELSGAVAENRCDFCIASRRKGEFRFRMLLRDEIVFILPVNHPLAEKEGIPLRAVEEEPYIDLYTGKETDNSRIFKKYQISPVPRYCTSDRYAGYAMVEAGLGIAMENRLIAMMHRDKVALRPIIPEQFAEIGMVYPREEMISPAARAFVSFALSREEQAKEDNIIRHE